MLGSLWVYYNLVFFLIHSWPKYRGLMRVFILLFQCWMLLFNRKLKWKELLIYKPFKPFQKLRPGAEFFITDTKIKWKLTSTRTRQWICTLGTWSQIYSGESTKNDIDKLIRARATFFLTQQSRPWSDRRRIIWCPHIVTTLFGRFTFIINESTRYCLQDELDQSRVGCTHSLLRGSCMRVEMIDNTDASKYGSSSHCSWPFLYYTYT